MGEQVWIDPEGGKLVEALRFYESRKKELEALITSSGYKHNDFAVVTLEARHLPPPDLPPGLPPSAPDHPVIPRDLAAGPL